MISSIIAIAQEGLPVLGPNLSMFERLINLGAPGVYLYFIFVLWKKLEALQAENAKLVDRYHTTLLDIVKQMAEIEHEHRE